VSSALWIALGLAVTVVVCYVLWLRVLVHYSWETDQQIDFSQIRPWKGDDGKD
jgi:hypothetical protein